MSRGCPTLVVQSVKTSHVLTDIEQPTGLSISDFSTALWALATTKPGTIEDPTLGPLAYILVCEKVWGAR